MSDFARRMIVFFLFVGLLPVSRSLAQQAPQPAPVAQPPAIQTVSTQLLEAQNSSRQVLIDLENLFEQVFARDQQLPLGSCSPSPAGSPQSTYEIVQEMQRKVDEVDARYAEVFSGILRQARSPAEFAQFADSVVKMHVLLKMAAVIIGYDDLYIVHDRIIRELVGQYRTELTEDGKINAVLANYQIAGGFILTRLADLDTRHSQFAWARRYRITVNSCEAEDNQFRFVIPQPAGGSSYNARLWAESTTLQMCDPILTNQHIKYFFTENYSSPAPQGLLLRWQDYSYVSATEQAKSAFVSQTRQQFENDPEVRLFGGVPLQQSQVTPGLPIPDGDYLVSLGARPGQSRLTISSAQGQPTEFVIRCDASNAVVQPIIPVQEIPRDIPLKSVFPQFQLLDLRLTGDSETKRTEAAVAGRMVHGFTSHVALQTQGEFTYESQRDYLGLNGNPLPASASLGTPTERGTRGLVDLRSTEFQFDLGPLLLYKHFQLALIQSLRYVKRTDFDEGGWLAQYVVSFNYVSNRLGNVGGYFTRANIDRAVVRTEQFEQTLFEETYLKILNRVGLNARINLPRDSYAEGDLQGSFAQDSAVRRNSVGGMARYVSAPWKKMRATAEIGFNEGFVGPTDSWRIGGGIRLGTWGTRVTTGVVTAPVPIIIPRVSYETRTRTIRSGNRPPVANAGPDQSGIRQGTRVVLDGTGSSDPEGDSLTHEWRQLGGEPVDLENRNTATPRFIAGNGQVYSFQLIVTDAQGLVSPPDVVSVTTLREDFPVILQFFSDPPAIPPTSSSSLVYEVRNAVRVRITGIDRDLPTSGRETVRPAFTTTYTLTAYNAVGDQTVAITTVEVRPFLPEIIGFVAVPSIIGVGQSSNLIWEARNADRVRITGPGIDRDLPIRGQQSVQPTGLGPNIYTLTAFSTNGNSTAVALATIEVVIRSPLPEILSFIAVPSSIREGQTSTLSWRTSNASSVTLLQNGVLYKSGLTSAGTSEEAPVRTTAYTLRACNSSNECITAQQDVRVEPR